MKLRGQFHSLAALAPRKELPVSIGKEAGCTPKQSGCSGEEKDSCRESNPSRPARSLVKILTKLPQLYLCPGTNCSVWDNHGFLSHI
jgi:hypothetical protein